MNKGYCIRINDNHEMQLNLSVHTLMRPSE